jgi:hypothetical protein
VLPRHCMGRHLADTQTHNGCETRQVTFNSFFNHISSTQFQKYFLTDEVAYAKSWRVVPNDPVAIYIDDSIHYQVSGQQAPAQWQSLLPPTGHLVYDSNGQPNTIAMYHQLECLDTIRKAFLAKKRNVTMETRDCFDYLQQAILCHGDSRIESIRWVGKPHIISVAGYWECRDWEALYEASRSKTA